MRKHGWQLPYHPLQVVAIAVFLALGFAFYVFFVPFAGKKVFRYVVMGLYTPLVTCVVLLYIWCAATDPGDPGVFSSKKYTKVKGKGKGCKFKDSEQEGSVLVLLGCFPLSSLLSGSCCSFKHLQEQQTTEDGMFYCSLCEVEVRKYSKHCRVCDKCVDFFDHHCRWLNNCIGRKNYRRFFALMILALILLFLQWSIGILVLILCFLERGRYSQEIASKLGSSFSLAPFIVVVASCTILAMLATLPLAQLFLFHVILIRKGISTYDYIVALREQEQQGVGQQSPQMSSVSSLTGFSSASSFNAFQRGSWCTPPRLFLEDQFDVIPQEINMVVNSAGKKMMTDEARGKKARNIGINPWALARMNAEEASKAASQARKKSKVLQAIVKQAPMNELTDEFNSQRRLSKRCSKPPLELPLEPSSKLTVSNSDSNCGELSAEASSCLAPLQLEARNAFGPLHQASSSDSSLDSPDLHPFRISSSAGSVLGSATPGCKGIELSRSASDGYEASGGEDSDQIPSRIMHRPFNWSVVVLNSGKNGMDGDLGASSIHGKTLDEQAD
ncbi:putative S-acyltransferase [Apostasia shenzhenica]|uniref:S-acyltransferase n=1 Tax=Apostasia shenzhenica TaxID=1088818 RepID=A0A2I0ADP4_9ASPA|nr:putative S-acyltransferase [Apostasia shenzhenica]